MRKKMWLGYGIIWHRMASNCIHFHVLKNHGPFPKVVLNSAQTSETSRATGTFEDISLHSANLENLSMSALLPVWLDYQTCLRFIVGSTANVAHGTAAQLSYVKG